MRYIENDEAIFEKSGDILLKTSQHETDDCDQWVTSVRAGQGTQHISQWTLSIQIKMATEVRETA